jgi:hypothetical protein
MAVIKLKGYTMRTAWHPIPEIGDWPLDHTAVGADDGTEWPCFGRSASQEPSATVVCEGFGEFLWANAIAGPDGHSGIEFGFTGICHHCSNRILIPARAHVGEAPGNEIATPLFGKYGLDVDKLVLRIKDAAFSANSTVANAVTDQQVTEAIELVTGGLTDEWEIVDRDIDVFIRSKLPDLSDDVYHTIREQYLSLYYRRVSLYRSLRLGRIAKDRYLAKMRGHFIQTLEDIQDLVGPIAFQQLLHVPIRLAAEYLFFEIPQRVR